jgi:hypothetical protein
MLAGDKRKEAMIMIILWFTVPIVALMGYLQFDDMDGFILAFLVIYTGIWFFIGLPIYFGHKYLMAGFNTMSPEQQKKYNEEKR